MAHNLGMYRMPGPGMCPGDFKPPSETPAAPSNPKKRRKNANAASVAANSQPTPSPADLLPPPLSGPDTIVASNPFDDTPPNPPPAGMGHFSGMNHMYGHHPPHLGPMRGLSPMGNMMGQHLGHHMVPNRGGMPPIQMTGMQMRPMGPMVCNPLGSPVPQMPPQHAPRMGIPNGSMQGGPHPMGPNINCVGPSNNPSSIPINSNSLAGNVLGAPNNNNSNNINVSVSATGSGPPSSITTTNQMSLNSSSLSTPTNNSSMNPSMSPMSGGQMQMQSNAVPNNNNPSVQQPMNMNPMVGPGPGVVVTTGNMPPNQMQMFGPPKPLPVSAGKVYPPDQPMVFNPQNRNAPPIYPCGVCHKEVHDNDQAMLCESGCNFWFHRTCSGLTEAAYQLIHYEVYAEWCCDKCLSSKSIPLVKFKP